MERLTFNHLPQPQSYKEPVAVTLPSGDRFYTTPDGIRYPSVTTILKVHSEAGLEAWRRRVGYDEAVKIKKRAGKRGNRVHDLLERTLQNQEVYPQMTDLEMYLSMMKYVKYINNIRLLEKALYSHALRLAGRSDCIAEYKGVLSVIDFKSSVRTKKAEWIEGYCMQVTAYAIMCKELFGYTIRQGVIIIGRDDELTAQVFVVRVADWLEELLECRDTWEIKYGNG